MAKGTRGRRRVASRQCRSTPYPLPSCNLEVSEDLNLKKCSKILEKKDWENATCSVCMEHPHNAVLLLCSSHDKGCCPYMCGTSSRYSNCLDQYRKAYTKVMSAAHHDQPSHASVDNSFGGSVSSWPVENCEATELACPLCRGQVKGWTVVEPAREYLNAKKRSCMQNDCSFVGTYKELRKHVRSEHPSARPREVDPALEQKWRRLEREREREDVISTIRSSMPGAMVFGDYVIEGSHYGFDTDEEDDEVFNTDFGERNAGFQLGIDSNLVNVFLLLHAFGPGGNPGQERVARRRERDLDRGLEGDGVGLRHTSPVRGFDSSGRDSDSNDDGDDDVGGDNNHVGMSLVHRLRRQGRVLLGRSGRRRRRREAGGGQR
ncbi:uncharacterized protein LOC127810325 [Diospyros lotus]|uniref:uncharacterized protein LOC127810325 n=1 Tax=Diospyros lotus TaxID=55363 RepID=UPI00225003CB|nr:uncharacterized protein LOC127810325 [Diospyros lotus]XP_052205702.1 uncharacterized protein LOC127810325 [Diospyros lotus]XP_052205703.1 uncharacterized protein LOC127810325 [Diospyros lotus]XP_052205704.1 uncharacterized protein LOC127810325 [Diospyros lotus]